MITGYFSIIHKDHRFPLLTLTPNLTFYDPSQKEGVLESL